MEPVRKYLLKSKNTTLISFSLCRESSLSQETDGYAIHIDHIYEEQASLFPKNLSMPAKITGPALMRWISERKVPANRTFADSLLRSIGDGADPLRYADMTYALSLNDAFWILPADQDLRWEAWNLYSHSFAPSLAQAAFTGEVCPVSGPVATPELTTCGALPKCWIRRKQGICLVKGDPLARPDGRSEAVMEYYAAQVAAVMNLPHIAYDLSSYEHPDHRRETVCLCHLFTSEAEGFIDADTYFRHGRIDPGPLDMASPSVQRTLAKAFGERAYGDMMVFDSVICNQDRHLGNFGYIVSNDTGRLLRPAPLYDNGRSLLYGAAHSDLDNMEQYMRESGLHGFFADFDEAASLFVSRRHLQGLRKLTGFSFRPHSSCPGLAADTIKKLNHFIRRRAVRILSLYRQRELARKAARKSRGQEK